MTTNDLIALVNDQRRDNTSYFVDNSEIIRYFNRCLRLLQSEHDWDFTQTSGSFTYATGTALYKLSAIGDGYWKNPIDLFAGYSYKFDFVTPEDFSYVSSLGYNAWSTRGNDLMVINNTNVTSLSVSYYSSAMVKTSGGTWQTELIDGTDVPLMPERFQDVLVDYTLMNVFKKEGSMDDFVLSQNDYTRKIQLLKNEYITKTARPLRRWKHVSETGAAGMVLDRREDPLGQTR